MAEHVSPRAAQDSPTPAKDYYMAICIYIDGDFVIDGYQGEQILLSYDATGTSRPAAVQACRLIFGRRRTDRHRRVRDEPGFIHRAGVVWIGQSVFILPPRDAEELATRLRRLGVRVVMAPVTIARPSLQRFRRPASGLA